MAKDTESTMKWKLDIADLKKGMQDARREISLANAEFKNATAGMGQWNKSADGVKAKTEQLAKVLQGQETILADLKQQYELTAQEMGETSPEAQKLKIQIENQEAACKRTQAQLADYNGKLAELQAEQTRAETPMEKLNSTIDDQEQELKELKAQYANSIVGDNPEEAARLGREIEELSSDLAENKSKMDAAEKAADDLDKSIDAAGDAADEASAGGFTVMKGALADLVSAGIQKAIEGMQQLASMVVDAGKEAVSSYADYEQLIGGVETLFGTGGIYSVEEYAKSVGKSVDEAQGEFEKLIEAQDEVFDNSRVAFKTAGMSQNAYMETVTSFSASLISSLGGDTAKAAGVADQAIIDMSDNANKMGSNMEDIQNAYQGFAKGNYDMLDNLKLGFGGTKEEALRLVKTAGVVDDSVKSMDDVSFAQMIEAIHIVQDEMGITGTTAKEASETVSGSQATMQAAWTNFLTALGDGEADLEPFWNDLVSSVETYAANLLPVVKDVASRAMELAVEKMREYFPEFMGFVDAILPPIKTAFNWIKDNAPLIVAAIAGIGTALGILALQQAGITGIKNALMGMEIVQKAVTAAQWLMNAAMNANPLGILVAVIGALVAAFVVLLATNKDFRAKVIEIWGNVKEFIGNAIEAIVNFFKELPSKVSEFLSSAWDTVSTWAVNMWNKAKEVGSNFIAGVVEFLKNLPYNIGLFLGMALGFVLTWAVKMWNKAKETGQKFITNVVTFFRQLPTKILTFITDALRKVGTWASSMASKAKETGRNFVNGVIDFVKNLPSKVWGFLQNVVSKVAEWGRNLASKGKAAAKSLLDAVVNGVKSIPDKVKGIGSDIVKGLWNGINDMVGWVKSKIEGFGNGVLDGLKKFFKIGSPSKLMRDEIGKYLAEGIAVGFGAEMPDTIRTMQKAMDGTVSALRGSASIALDGTATNAYQNGSVGSFGDAAAAGSKTQTVVFNQYNTSPKALDRLTVYRDTKSLLFSAKVGLNNV